jgi:hypothetical protein
VAPLVEGLFSGSITSHLLAALLGGVVQVFLGPILPTLMTVLYLDYARRLGS